MDYKKLLFPYIISRRKGRTFVRPFLRASETTLEKGKIP